MSDVLALRKVERLIESVARGYSIPGSDFEDLVQIGRIGVWKLLEKYSVTEENVECHGGLIKQAVEFALNNELKSAKAQKRLALNLAESLDEPFSDEDGRTFYDTSPSSSEDALALLVKQEDAHELLKKLKDASFIERTPESKRAVVWLLVHILDLNRQDIPKLIRYETFVRFGLQRWLWVFFNNSPYRAINHAYPGIFLPYQMAQAPRNYWMGARGKQRAIKALRNILLETGYSPEYFPKIVVYAFFEEFKIAVPLGRFFGWNRFAYLDAAFPGVYHPWELSVTPKSFFDSNENVVRAVRWLVEEKFGFNMPVLTIYDVWREQVAMRITKEIFLRYGLSEIMANYKSPEPILRMVYPDKFLSWSFQSKGKWQGEEGRRLAATATQWLIEEYVCIDPLSPKITCAFFREYGLWGMLTAKSLGFQTSPRNALKNAYPGLFA